MSVFCSRRWVAKRFGISTCHSARGRLHSLSAIPGRLGRLRAAADVLLRSLPSDLRVPPTSVGLANNLRCSASRLHSRLRRRRDRARATAYSEQDHQHNYLQNSYPPSRPIRGAADRVSWANIAIAKYRHSNHIIVVLVEYSAQCKSNPEGAGRQWSTALR